jgi:rhodanese-related sulfurtransferase
MSPREVADLLDHGGPEGAEGPLLLDVREPWEFSICRIEGARLVPMARIPQAISDLDPERETVVVCHHGIRSYQVARFLEQQGFKRVVNLSGGVAAWARDLDPEMRTY